MSARTSNNPGFNGGADQRERLSDLLVSRATEGLDATAAAELERLLAANPGVDAEEFELAAAMAAVAMIEPDMQREGMPESLRGRLNGLAENFGRQMRAAPSTGVERAPNLRLVETDSGRRAPAPARSPIAWMGWLAAAAAVAIAAVGWMRGGVGGGGSVSPAPTVTLAAQFESFKKSAVDAIHWPWAGKEKGYEGVKGEVYWSDSEQRGFMLLSGLAPNDPKVKQYQLWIVDPKRDKHPVDGGVFDIAQSPAAGDRLSTGEVVVPIDCKLRVESPAAFALTVEQPGGVVVSAGPLVVVAAK